MMDDELAMHANIPVKVLRAIRYVESNGKPSAVRFEPHVFLHLCPTLRAEIPYTGPGPSHIVSETNRGAFEHARTLDKLAAVKSTSWGLYQEMGIVLLGLVNGDPDLAVQMFDADPQGTSEKLLVAWFQANPQAARAARKLDFVSLAKAYNGSGNVAHYSALLQKAYDAQP